MGKSYLSGNFQSEMVSVNWKAQLFPTVLWQEVLIKYKGIYRITKNHPKTQKQTQTPSLKTDTLSL